MARGPVPPASRYEAVARYATDRWPRHALRRLSPPRHAQRRLSPPRHALRRLSLRPEDDPIPPGPHQPDHPLGVPGGLTLPSGGHEGTAHPLTDLGCSGPEDDPIPPGPRGTGRPAGANRPAQRSAPFLVWS
ncbi:MAG: hypothetical protein ACYCX8_12000 [Acidimicrobiales bacterium]